MAVANVDNNPVMTIILLAVAATSGIKGMNISEEELDYYNKLLALVLKGVSIISFILLILLNFQKLFKMVVSLFSSKKN